MFNVKKSYWKILYTFKCLAIIIQISSIANADILTINPDNNPCQEIIAQCCDMKKQIETLNNLIAQTHGIYREINLETQTHDMNNETEDCDSLEAIDLETDEQINCLFSIDEFTLYERHRRLELKKNEICLKTHYVESIVLPDLRFSSRLEASRFHKTLKLAAANTKKTSLLAQLYHASALENTKDVILIRTITISPNDAITIYERIKEISTCAVTVSTSIDFCRFDFLNTIISPAEIRFQIDGNYSFSIIPTIFYHPKQGAITIFDAIELIFNELEYENHKTTNIVDLFENNVIRPFIFYQR